MINFGLIIGCICTMLANIFFGSSLAKLKEEFNKEKFWTGVFKVVTIILGIFLLYIAGYFNPNILMVNINGTDLNVISALETLFTVLFVTYGCMSIDKLAKIFKLKVDIKELELTDEQIEEFTDNKGDDEDE